MTGSHVTGAHYLHLRDKVQNKETVSAKLYDDQLNRLKDAAKRDLTSETV